MTRFARLQLVRTGATIAPPGRPPLSGWALVCADRRETRDRVDAFWADGKMTCRCGHGETSFISIRRILEVQAMPQAVLAQGRD